MHSRSRLYQCGDRVPLEIEVDTFEQLDVGLRARPDVVLLDNMGVGDLRQAVRCRNAAAPGVLLEACGSVTVATVWVTLPPPELIGSASSLDHSAAALDIGSGLPYLSGSQSCTMIESRDPRRKRGRRFLPGHRDTL